MTREEAIVELKWFKGHTFNSTEEALDMAIQALESKKGKWGRGYSFPDGVYWRCSECGEFIKVKFPMNFCNSCGSDMRGE